LQNDRKEKKKEKEKERRKRYWRKREKSCREAAIR
jgi:hypothetical protein